MVFQFFQGNSCAIFIEHDNLRMLKLKIIIYNVMLNSNINQLKIMGIYEKNG